MRYVLGLDLGSERDPAAIAILKRIEKFQKKQLSFHNSRPIRQEKNRIVSELHLVYMENIPLKTAYHDIVAKVKYMLDHPDWVGDIMLVVDRTGVGIPVMQNMVQEGLSPIGITYHGGNTVNQKDGHYNVPKRDLVTALLVAMQMGRFKTERPENMPIIKKFEDQLQGFKMKINQRTGHDSYEAELERIHDDLVMAAAMAVWWFDRVYPQSSLVEET